MFCYFTNSNGNWDWVDYLVSDGCVGQPRSPVMIIAQVKGNLVKMFQSATERNVPFIAAQGCNMQATQGSGIAGQLRVIPEIYQADLEAYNDNEVAPDFPSIARFNQDNQLFFNLYTQETPGPTARYEYIREALQTLTMELAAEERLNEPVFIPQIGCGIGGLEWSKVKEIFEEVDIPLIVVHFDGE